jgi:hypothetical protein
MAAKKEDPGFKNWPNGGFLSFLLFTGKAKLIFYAYFSILLMKIQA